MHSRLNDRCTARERSGYSSPMLRSLSCAATCLARSAPCRHSTARRASDFEIVQRPSAHTIPDTYQRESRARLMTGGGYRLLASDKLWRAFSRLYQRRFLRPNTHFSAFFEIYKIGIPLHRLNVKISAKFRKTFSHFFVNFLKNRYFQIVFVDFFTDFDEIFSEFRQIS